jgi:protein TonB
MKNSAILTADILDIIFEGRNKDYGAYELRRTYNKRLYISISVMLSVILLFLASFVLPGKQKEARDLVIADPTLIAPPPEVEPVVPPVPPPQKPPPQQVQQKMFTTFRLTNEEVKPEEKPPINEELEDTKIGTQNIDGLKDDGLQGPPPSAGDGKGIIDLPKKPEEDYNGLFLKVEIESKYPGGAEAWRRFLIRNLSNNYPQEAIDNQISGTVMVQFIVDQEGNVSDVEAISGPVELRAVAVKMIRKSGKWEPAIQNHRKVKSYKRQPITFTLMDE